ncbi:MAG: EamA family transporter [Syntrophales bacterium]
MSWFFLSLLAALSLATSDALTKRFFSNLSPLMMGIIRLGYALPWLLAALFFIPWIIPDTTFWSCIAIGLPLEALAFYCYMKALKVSPLSLTVPFLAFTPGFIILTGWIILGEEISPGGFCGIILIIVGAYFLNLSKTRYGLLDPLKAVFREPGSRLMLLVSFIYAFTSTIGKLAIIHSNPYFFGITYNMALVMLMTLFLPAAANAETGKNLIRRPLIGLILGALVATTIFSHVLAISMTNVAYMISLKRTSILFGVLYGALWFKEEKFTERLTGAIIMITGVFLIGWFG